MRLVAHGPVREARGMAKRLSSFTAAERKGIGGRIALAMVAQGYVLGGEPNRKAWAEDHPPFGRKYMKLVEWVRGESAPDLPTARALAAALGVSMDWLVHGFGEDGEAALSAWRAARGTAPKAGFDRHLRRTWTLGMALDARSLEWMHTGYSDGLTPAETRTVAEHTKQFDSRK
jgi:Helix-turn-helix